ncbi:MAG: protein-disulfide reductase DsbD domain-containing protein, partial [Sphingomonas sp.]
MRALRFILLTILALIAQPALAQAPDPYSPGPHLMVRLVAETMTPAAGQDVTIAYDVTPQPGWHGYWQNPGDAGFPARFTWNLPAGVTADAPHYPVPTTLLISGLMNYVFERHHTLLVQLHVPAGLAKGTALPVKLASKYLVCTTEICVPENADLSLDLTVGDGAVSPASRAQFDQWRQALPRPLGMAASYQLDGKRLRLGIPYPATAPLKDAYFFPATTGALDYAAPQKVARDGDRLVIETGAHHPKGPIEGVLRTGDGQGLSIGAAPGAVAPAAGDSAAGGDWMTATLVALGGAILGGLILNIMPCVFPILSLKALSLAKGSVSPGAARAEALAYTAGVMLVIVGLG